MPPALCSLIVPPHFGQMRCLIVLVLMLICLFKWREVGIANKPFVHCRDTLFVGHSVHTTFSAFVQSVAFIEDALDFFLCSYDCHGILVFAIHFNAIRFFSAEVFAVLAEVADEVFRAFTLVTLAICLLADWHVQTS